MKSLTWVLNIEYKNIPNEAKKGLIDMFQMEIVTCLTLSSVLSLIKYENVCRKQERRERKAWGSNPQPSDQEADVLTTALYRP